MTAWFTAMKKMASVTTKSIQIETSRKLEYTKSVEKIPECLSVNEDEQHQLKCSNAHSLVVIYNDFFKVLGAIYQKQELHDGSTQSCKKQSEILRHGGSKIVELKEIKVD